MRGPTSGSVPKKREEGAPPRRCRSNRSQDQLLMHSMAQKFLKAGLLFMTSNEDLQIRQLQCALPLC